MKNLILLALFVLTWQSYKYQPFDAHFSSGTGNSIGNITIHEEGYLLENHHKLFDSKKKMKAFRKKLEMDKTVTNIKLYEAKGRVK